MRQLTSIVAVNREGVIGCRNALPWRVKSDLAFFRSQTSDNVVLMGRRTFDSLGRCLPNRFNIVLSKNTELFPDGEMCVSRAGVIDGLYAIEAAPLRYEEAYVIGGATMYDQFHDLVDRYLITVVEKRVDGGDAFFNVDVLNRADAWDVHRIAAGAKSDADEAAFEVFELVARDRERRREARSALLTKARERAGSRPVKVGLAKHRVPTAASLNW